MYVVIQEWKEILVHLEKKTQIQAYSRAQVKALLFGKASTAVAAEYSNCSNVFLSEYAMEFLEHTRINDYSIKLKKDK